MARQKWVRREWTEDLRDTQLPPCFHLPTDSPPPRVAAGGTKVYQTEEKGELLNRMIDDVRAAQEFVCVSSFIFSCDPLANALLAAAARGVRVYLLTASEAHLNKLPRDDDEFSQKCLHEHKALLDRLAGRIVVRTASHFHAKALLVDPCSPRWTARGWLLTANLTQEALTRNEELAVQLNPDEVEQAFSLFRIAFWEAAEHELLDKGRLGPATPAQRFFLSEHARGSGPETISGTLTLGRNTSGYRALRNEVLRLITNARKRLIIAMYGFGHEAVLSAIEERARAGVAVELLVRMRAASLQPLIRLAGAGVKTFGLRWLHAKAIWNDNDEALVMSANLENRGLESGFELGVMLHGEDAASIASVLEQWKAQRAGAFHAKPVVGDLLGSYVSFSASGRPERFVVEKEAEFELGEVQRSATHAKGRNSGPPERRRLPDGTWAHFVVYRWEEPEPSSDTPPAETSPA
ncbi:MAG: hypothetical protein KatS3mg102_0713 [Planctomycetota bacterium]|nr:MAG: hypothetical protein KatS3mg102_0713 [Planctomycetota bacterium]